MNSPHPEARPRTVIVVPCYNEAERLDRACYEAFLKSDPARYLLFVDDGSKDATLEVVAAIRDAFPEQVRVLCMERNQGKGEAVRSGVLQAAALAPTFIGYWDADLSTSLDEVAGFEQHLAEHSGLLFVMGARVKLLGHNINRKPHRHLLGRVFATLASAALELPVYDTQCGAKLFRATPECLGFFSRAFSSPWVFDVELLARVREHARSLGVTPGSLVAELPVVAWRDVGGSKLKVKDMAKSLYYLAQTRSAYR